MARSKTSHRWLKEHFKDPYVISAKNQGYRSRACFKLLEIQKKDSILKSGMNVVDLGASPGSWSQVASQIVGDKGCVIASDILEMDSLPDVTFVQGDFTEDSVVLDLLKIVGERKIDLVICDMAPNMSGIPDVDIPRAMLLSEYALDFCNKVLKKDGDFLIKVFQGEGFDFFLKEMRSSFKKVLMRKPSSSRDRSREQYMLGRSFKGSLKI